MLPGCEHPGTGTQARVRLFPDGKATLHSAVAQAALKAQRAGHRTRSVQGQE